MAFLVQHSKNSEYLSNYNWTYKGIQQDLQKMSESVWNALTYFLIHQKVNIVDASIDIEADNLLRMGIITKGKIAPCFSRRK